LGSSFSEPEPQMIQYPSNDLLIFNDTDNAHFPLASGAGKGICLISTFSFSQNNRYRAADNRSPLCAQRLGFLLHRVCILPGFCLDRRVG
jgi:hypothetical protein